MASNSKAVRRASKKPRLPFDPLVSFKEDIKGAFEFANDMDPSTPRLRAQAAYSSASVAVMHLLTAIGEEELGLRFLSLSEAFSATLPSAQCN